MKTIKNLSDEEIKTDELIPEPKIVRDRVLDQKIAANRIYKGDVDVDHDLFKLEVATMRKNISINPNDPVYTGVEHCHFFHSFDSSGKRQDTSNPIAGHYHKVETFIDQNGNITAKSGPALKKVGGREVALDDNHVHEVTYVRSERIKVRQVNAEAQKSMAAYNALSGQA